MKELPTASNPVNGNGQTFGNDAATYHRYRPGYPDALFALLRDHCGLAPGIASFEVGAGTGQATRVLLRSGVDPLTVIEPDARLAGFITADADRDGHGAALDLRVEPFEETVLEDGAYDLGVAATSLHWLDQPSALRKAAMALRPGGWWAMWWSIYGDPSDRDAFHEATYHLFDWPDHGSYAPRASSLPFPLDEDARCRDLRETGRLTGITVQLLREMRSFTTEEIAGLYRTFSPLSSRPAPERERIIAALADISERQFGGHVERTVLTPVYLARRR